MEKLEEFTVGAAPVTRKVPVRDLVTSLLEILGAVCVLIGAFAFDWRAGAVCLGVFLITVGVLLGGDR